MKFLNRGISFFDRINKILAFLTGTLIVLIMLIICAEVIMRFLFNRSITGAVEITEYFLLFISFLGAAWLLAREGHVRVDIVVNKLSPRIEALVNVLTSILGAFICFTFTYYGVKVTWVNYQQLTFIPSPLEPPFYPILAIIPIGNFLLFIQFLIRTQRYVEAWKALKK